MLTLRFCLFLFALACVLWMTGGTVRADADTTEKAKKFVIDYEKKMHPLDIAAGCAWWNANITGKDEDFEKKEHAQNRIDEALSNKDVFAEAKAMRESKMKMDDPVTARAVDVLYLIYLEKQVDPELLKKITAKANAVEQKFNVYRAKVDGKEMTDSEVRKILKESTDSARRKAVWEASKGVGADVVADAQGTGQTSQRDGETTRLQELPRPVSCTSTSRTATN